MLIYIYCSKKNTWSLLSGIKTEVIRTVQILFSFKWVEGIIIIYRLLNTLYLCKNLIVQSMEVILYNMNDK